jgi:hypothetical protein
MKIVTITALLTIMLLSCNTNPIPYVPSVTIRLYDTDGNPVYGATVILTSHTRAIQQTFQETSSKSYVQFSNVPHGIYSLRVMHDDFIDYISEFFEIADQTFYFNANLTPLDGLANLTIYLKDFEIPEVFNNRYNLHNINNVFNWFRGEVISGGIRFSGIEPGFYTLPIPGTFPHHFPYSSHILYRNIRVEKGSNTYIIDRPASIITIENRTGEAINRIYTTPTDFVEFVCKHGSGIGSRDFLAYNVSLGTGDNLSIIVFCMRPTHIRLRGSYEQYTIFSVDVIENVVVTFKETDLDGLTVKHPIELEDFTRFPIQIHHYYCTWREHGVLNLRWHSHNLSNAHEMNLTLLINGLDVNLRHVGWFTGLPIQEIWEAYLDIVAGQTYKLTLTLFDHHTYEFEEVMIYSTVQKMIINAPESIDDGAIYLSWVFYPNNSLDPGFNTLSIHSLGGTWGHRIHLMPSQRDIMIPAGLIPSSCEGTTIFIFDKVSYSTSGMVSFRDSRGSVSTTVRFIDGILQ